jgi:hypothetical protein
MSQANEDFTTPTSRRRFLGTAAVASVVGAGSLAMAAMPAPAHQRCFAADDSELLRLEKEIFAAREAAQAYDGEIIRLSELPASEEQRLTTLQRPHWLRHDEALERMFVIPAQTAQGRGAKASVILGLMAAFMVIDEDESYPLDLVRKFLVEIVGGEPHLRDGSPIVA